MDERMGQGRGKRRAVSWFLAGVLAAGILAALAAAGQYWLFDRPYRACEDCRGQEIDVETMKRWEERAQDGSLGIVRMAGWRTGPDETVTSVSTGRRQRAGVTCVYGSMELTDRGDLLWGRMGIQGEEDFCVISEELARNLFGSVDVVGECVKAGDRTLAVAGVMDEDGETVMIPVAEGNVEYLSVEFDGRMGAEGKMKRLLEEY